MAASEGSPSPLASPLKTDDSDDQGPVPNKKMKIEAAAELVGGSNTGTAEEKRQMRIGREKRRRQRKTATPAVGEGASPAPPAINTPPLPVRYPLFPKPVNGKDGRELRIDKKDPRTSRPTVMKPKDPRTAHDVTSSRDKAAVRHVALSIVSITSIDGNITNHFTGIVVGWNKTRKCARILTSSETITGCDPKPKLPSFGSKPNYGQEVFVLARDEESYLMARHGTILWLEKPDYLGRNCHMFLSCQPPVCGSGGPVIDLDGNVSGMVFEDFSSNPPILAISTILTCMEMWMKFSRIAYPIHGLRLRTVEVSLQEVLSVSHNINSGYIVDEVSVGSTAEKLGIRYGDVIVSFNGLYDHTLPQLEDFLLSVGWRFLQGSTDSSSTDLKLEVHDLLGHSARTIILPIEFCDASEVVY